MTTCRKRSWTPCRDFFMSPASYQGTGNQYRNPSDFAAGTSFSQDSSAVLLLSLLLPAVIISVLLPAITPVIVLLLSVILVIITL